jgi:anion-transporting  ArsA/GET3 family ATPase
MPSDAGGALAELLERRLVFVAGKGGTGKSTIAGALALIAARQGKRVLCIDTDAKGDLAGTLGSPPVGFQPRVVQPNISVLTLQPDESLQEYLHIYFKVPRFARLTPLARVFDFVATGVPGAREMLVIGKIAFEEKRRDRDGSPAWDLIIVDAEATGHVLPQLRAARAMLDLVKGGIIRSQVEWIDAILTDPRRTLLTVCALPEEMPVVEALELYERARREASITVGACFLNRTMPVSLTPRQRQVLDRIGEEPHAAALGERLGGDVAAVVVGARLAQRLHDNGLVHAKRLRAGIRAPVIEVPLQVEARPGLATTRAVAAALQSGART